MKKTNPFIPNVDHLVPFNSQVMLINDIEGSENGMNLIMANTDGPPIHTHPVQEELLTVVDGVLQVYRDNTWNTVRPGESIHIKKNQAHTYRNRSNEPCVFEYKITPKGNFSQMMITLETLSKERKLTSTKDLKSIIYMAMTFKKYNKDVRSVTPPDFVMSIFSWVGKAKGYQID